MFWPGEDRKGVFYKKSLVLALFIALVPIVLIGISAHYISTNRIETEINRTHQLQFNKALERGNDTLSNLELSLTQWAQNPLFGNHLKSLNLVDDYNKIYDLHKSILTMEKSNPVIERIAIFLDTPSIVLGEEMVKRLTDEEREQFNTLLNRKQTMFWSKPLTGSKVISSSDSMILVHKLSGQSAYHYGAILVYINKKQLDELVGELTTDSSEAAFIIDQDKQVLSTVPDDTNHQNMQVALTGEVAKRSGKSGTFIWNWQGSSYSVSYGTMERLGDFWTEISTTTMSRLTAPVVMISRLILSVSLAAFLLAVVLSWMASNKLYRPIHKIVQMIRKDGTAKTDDPAQDELALIESEWRHVSRKSELLQDRLNRAMPTLKEGFLLQLVQGHIQFMQEEDIQEQMQQFGLHTNEKVYSIIFVQLLGLSQTGGRFSKGDEQLVSFAAANIIEELTGRKYDQFGVVNFRNLSVGLLITLPDELSPASLKRETLQFAGKLIHTLSDLLKLQVIVSVGKPVSAVKQIHSHMVEAIEAIRYRDVEKDSQIIDTEQLLPHGEESIFYPFDLERELIQAMRLGNVAEVSRLVTGFVEEMLLKSVKESSLQQSMMQLLGSILHVVIQTGFNPQKLYEGANLYEHLLKLREPGEIVAWFEHKVLGPYIHELSQVQELYANQLVSKVAEMIRERYNEDISLESCSDMFGTTAVKLSYAFKRYMGINFIDYLTKVRIDQVKNLLIHTNLKISDIAYSVGYQPTYFNRIFKKIEGMTASEYRDKYRI